jgi:hypothetical protein
MLTSLMADAYAAACGRDVKVIPEINGALDCPAPVVASHK